MQRPRITGLDKETGIDVELGRLLYVCDHLPGDGIHVIHMTFEAARTDGTAGATAEGVDTTPIAACISSPGH